MKNLFTFLVVFFAVLTAHAQTLPQAEKLYQEGDFASAQKQYEEIIKTASGETLYQAQLRTAACQYAQGEYLNAAKTMFNFALPQDPLWKVRFLLYRINMAKQTSNVYSPILEEREIAENNDMDKWTSSQWRDQIQRDYASIWALRNDLLKAPIEQETLILNLKDTDTKRIPTLFDFVVSQWTQWLTNTEQVLPPAPTHTYLEGYATPIAKYKNRADTIANILQTAYQTEGTGRQEARLFWQTDYLTLPLEKSNLFELSKPDKAVQVAVAQLKNLSGYQSVSQNWWNKLKKLVAPSSTDYAKSYAAYKAANLLYAHEDRTQALAICNYATSSLERSYYTDQCQQLADSITRPELSFDQVDQALNPTHPQMALRANNLAKVYIRIYSVTKDQLLKWYQDENKRYRRDLSRWNNLFDLENKDILQLLGSSANYQSQQETISYEKPYFQTKKTITLPPLASGFYVVLACAQETFDAQNSPVVSSVINITDLALFTTAAIEDNPEQYVSTLDKQNYTYTPALFRVYTVDLKSGTPQTYVNLDLITNWNGSRESANTGESAVATLKRTIKSPNNSSHMLDVWAEKNGNTALSTRPLHFYYDSNTPVKFFIQTDRPIYRPGQKVYLSVQGFQATPRGQQVLGPQKAELTVRSYQNNKTIFKTNVTLNEFGTAQTSFTLPQGNEILLGEFGIEVKSRIQNKTFSHSHSFSVEEYKRPEYEIELNDPKEPLRYHQKGTVTGKATYYTGTPLQKATVKYTVFRREYIPPFYWWRIWNPAPAEQIAQGETTTNDKGEFSVSWKPEPTRKDETSTQYTVKAEVYDETGRAIDASRTYHVNTYAHLFKVTFTQGFYDANRSVPLAHIKLTDADGNSTTGDITVRMSRLENKLPAKTQPADKGYQPVKTNLDSWYQDAKEVATVFTKKLSFTNKDEQLLQLPSVAEGIYRLTLQSSQAQTQSMIFIVAEPESSLQLPDVTLVQQAQYYPGETARILLGSTTLKGSKRVEILRKGEFLATHALLPGGVSIYSYPVTEADRGGLSLVWFGASDYQFHQGSISMVVPFDNQVLNVQLDNPAVLKPGQTVQWNLMARDAKKAPIQGQASLTVYDKSLDYYAKKQNPFSLDSLFRQNNSTPDFAYSALSAHTNYIFTGEHPSTNWKSPLALPTLNLEMPRIRYGMRNVKGLYATAAAPQMLMAKSAARALDADMMAVEEESAFDSIATNGASLGTVTAAGVQNADEEVQIRTDFAETAFFDSLLPIKNGVAPIRFTFPQSVTTWNILGFALTKDAKLGEVSASTITRKDFMVRLHLPRFYREKDSGILQASVMNLTNKKITVPVTLSVQQDKQNKAAAFGIDNTTKQVTVLPNATAFVQWDITVPAKPGLYDITAVARQGSQSDGEQRTLPVFPSLSRLLASAHTALQNGSNTLTITELNDVSDAKAELAALTVNPSLALSVLNSMPNLLSTPYKDLISSLNRYVPLAIVHTFYNTYPQLKEAVKKLPKRAGISASWDQTDPLRLTMLEQTPWLQHSLGQTQHTANIISLFDDQIVSKRLEQERAAVLKLQNANGSFSWFAGGPEDSYLTLRALDAFGQAVRFGAEVPQAQIQKALAYITPRIEKQLKEDKTGSAGTVSYALYAAYTLSAFPANWPQMSATRPYIKKWVDYADQQSRFMTPLGQIYAAAVYHRLGDDVKANAYLDKVLARMKYNPLTGAYFAPEAQSWIWYQDTITTQTATLKTLLEIRPQSDKIDPMVQWLLFNRQVTSWQNPAAAAKAVFALLDVMQTKGALTAPTTYQINWAGTQQKRTFEPFDWTEDLQWVKQGAQLTPNVMQAQVTKQGKMTDFASLDVVYTSAQAKASPKGVLNVAREYFVRFEQDGTQKLRPIKQGDDIKVGDEVEVHLTLTTDSAFEYVHLNDPKPAGFESADLHSSWTWNPLSMYREIRDADTNFFIDRLPAGTVTLRYVLRPTVPGKFHAKPAQIQSMYAPEYGAHSAAETVNVRN